MKTFTMLFIVSYIARPSPNAQRFFLRCRHFSHTFTNNNNNGKWAKPNAKIIQNSNKRSKGKRLWNAQHSWFFVYLAIHTNKNIFVGPCVHFRLVWLLIFHLLPLLLLLVCIFVHIVADFINTFGGQTNAAATALHTHELSLLFFLHACLLAWYFVAATLRLCGCVFILNLYRLLIS